MKKLSLKSLLTEDKADVIAKDVVNNFEKITGVKPGHLVQGYGRINFTRKLADKALPKIRNYVKKKYKMDWSKMSDQDVIDNTINLNGAFLHRYL